MIASRFDDRIEARISDHTRGELIGLLVAEPASALCVAGTGAVVVARIANGFRVHLPKARVIRQQLLELDRL